MNNLYAQWKKDEETPFTGWDFSYLKGRWREEQPPWDYESKARELLRKATAVLDMGTGGGEVLSSLDPFPKHTVATESWPPNIVVARGRLEPLGIKVVEVGESEQLPFANSEFDVVLNRHSHYSEREVYRILEKDGVFLTQQVGGDNLGDLIQEFNAESEFEGWTLETAGKQLEQAGFDVEETEEWSGEVEFRDVGAVVYFLKAIPWIVRDFSVDNYFATLRKLQERIDAGKRLLFVETRFLIRARK